MGNRIFQDARKFVELAKNSGPNEQACCDFKSKECTVFCLCQFDNRRKRTTPGSAKRVRWTKLNGLLSQNDKSS